jgi:hypothetical protein
MTGKRNETLTTDLKYPMGGLVYRRHSDAVDVRKRSDDLVPLISHCSVGIHGSMA